MSDSRFAWDEAKDSGNQLKHGASFGQAEYAFFNENRIIAEDLRHSDDEKRYMNKKIKYSDVQLNELKLVPDFLPTPQELSLRNRNTKITISLSTESVNYFKDQANHHDMQYQKMIRQLLDDYVTQQKALTSSNTNACC